MKVIKAGGEPTLYDSGKIKRSLERVGAEQRVIEDVIEETKKELYDGITTKMLYKIVFKNLKRLKRSAAGRYHLKKAIMELGPSGFPFENFIASLLEAEGCKTVTNQIVSGRCVQHEIDVIAEIDRKNVMIECKFRGKEGSVCDIKEALYIYARFLDVENSCPSRSGGLQKFDRAMLATNARLTSDAEKYCNCVGMDFLSWNSPRGNSIRERIDRNGLYPLTCLTTLSKNEKELLLNKNVVLCHSICERPALLNGIGLSKARKVKVLEEMEILCR